MSRSAEFSAPAGSDENATSSTLRAFLLLEHIATSDEPRSLEQLTRASGLPKPTVHRILRLMMRGGLLEREIDGKRYVVSQRMCTLALAVQMGSPQRRERHAILARLVEQIGE